MALGASVLFCGLAYLNVADDSRTVFIYFVNLVTIFGLESWNLDPRHSYLFRQSSTSSKPPEQCNALCSSIRTVGIVFRTGRLHLGRVYEEFRSFHQIRGLRIV